MRAWASCGRSTGQEPLFEPPAWESPEPQLTVSATQEHIEPVDHFVPFSNSCDIQHLIVVHGIKLNINPQDMEITRYSIKYLQEQDAPGMGHLPLWIKCTAPTLCCCGRR